MTIIQPNKNNHALNFYISILVAILIAAAVWSVFVYNQVVNLRHDAKQQIGGINRAEVLNAELKQNIYSAINTVNLQSILNSQPLILEKNPNYLKKQPLAASY